MWGSSRTKAWPVVLRDDHVVLRPIEVSDGVEWSRVRLRNADWLQPWEATVPPGAGPGPETFRELVRSLQRAARAGRMMPFVIEVEGRLVGQVTVSHIVRGSAQYASIGYWIDRAVAGRGIVPRAVAMAIDHCFTGAGLHRVEICIRPENTNSLRVVEKLGLHEVGYAPAFLHIDGAWRDHRIYAVTTEEAPRGMVQRLREQSGGQPHESHRHQ